MTQKEFQCGWELLAAQPWGRDYAIDLQRQAVARETYWTVVQDKPAQAWTSAINWWIKHESHFPTIPELLEQIRRFVPKQKLLPSPEVESGINWGQQIINEYVEQRGPDTVREVANRVLQKHLESHPHDTEAREILMRFEQRG